jgi:LEA14-like dessication related protein
MKNWKTITAIALLIASAGGLLWYYRRQKKLLLDYDRKLIGLKIVQLSADKTVINFIIRFTNKSDIEATINRMYSDLYVNDVYVGYLSDTRPMIIPAKGYSDIEAQISFSPILVLKNILTILLSSASLSTIRYKLKGYASIKSGLVSVSVPFEYEGTLKDF